MVYDCFQFFNEFDILKLRLHVMNPVVDKFVISEATETFSGFKKPLYFEENRHLFKEFEDKIIHVTVTDTFEGNTHDRDTFQKNAVAKGLAGCRDDDVIIFSDLDEIPNPEKVREISALIGSNENDAQEKIFHLAQRLFYCYLNMEEVSGNLLACCGEFEGITDKKWLGSKMFSYKLAKGQQLGELRWAKVNELGVRVDDGGWHFGYMGGKGEKDVRKRVAEKVHSAAHQEYNNRNVLSEVADRIMDGEDIFGRSAKFVQVPLDDTFPEYLRSHKEEYAHLIKPEESRAKEAFRHFRRNVRKRVRIWAGACKGQLKRVLKRG